MIPILASATNLTSEQYAAQAMSILVIASAVGVGWIASSLVLAAIFWKADEDRWKAWIPVYREIIYLRMGRFSGWMVLLSGVPVVNTIVYLIATYHIGQSFKKSSIGWVLLMVFLYPVYLLILAFDDSIWHDAEELGKARKAAPARIGRVASLK